MRCDDSRELLGIADELSSQEQLQLQAHISGCQLCARAASDESAFRALMAGRTVAAGKPARRAAMMQVPPPGARRLALKQHLTRGAPIAAATVAMLLGAWVLVFRPATLPADSRARLAGSEPVPSGVSAPGIAGSSAAPVRRLARVAIPVARPGPASIVAAPPVDQPDVVIIVPREPVVEATSSPATVGAGPSPSRPPEGVVSDSSGPGPTGPGSPSPTPAPPPRLLLTIQALTDLAGGEIDCPGCDGIAPADSEAARIAPVGAAHVSVKLIDAAGSETDLGPVTLSPTDESMAAGTISVPPAAAYVVTFVGADGGFVLCTGAAPEVTVTPAEGGMFAAFRLWRGCPVLPLRLP